MMSMSCTLHKDENKLYAELVFSILEPFDIFIEEFLSDSGVVILNREYIDIRLKEDVDINIHLPWIVGTKLWYIKKKTCLDSPVRISLDVYKTEAPPIHMRECWLCFNNEILLSFFINNVLYTTSVFSYFDSQRPKQNNTNYFEKVLYKLPSDFSSHMFSNIPHRLITIVDIELNFIKTILSYGKTMSIEQNARMKNALWRGNIDSFISKRLTFQSTKEDNNDPFNRNIDVVNGFSGMNQSNRFNQAVEGIPLIIKQQTITLMSLTPRESYVSTPRLISKYEEGFVSPSKVTETNRAGQQKLITLGVRFPRRRSRDPWEFFLLCLTYFKELGYEMAVQSVVHGYNLKACSLELPKTKITLLKFVLYCFREFLFSVDFVENENKDSNTRYYIYPSFYVPVVSSKHNHNIKLTLFSRYFFSDVILFTPTFFSLLDRVTPFINRSHPPKTFQAITKMSQSVASQESLRITGNRVDEYYESDSLNNNLPGCSFENKIYVETNTFFRQHTENDEDSIIVSKSWCEKFRSKRFKKEKITIGDDFKILYQRKGPLYGGEVFLVFQSSFVDLKKHVIINVTELRRGFEVRLKKITSFNVKYYIIHDVFVENKFLVIMFQKVLKSSVLVGDKFTSIHGQKVTVSNILNDDHMLFKNEKGEKADALLSATCLKRMNIGELIFSYVLSCQPHMAKYCFGEYQFFIKLRFDNLCVDNEMFKIFFIKLKSHPDDVISFNAIQTAIPHPLSMQNCKGRNSSNGIVMCTKCLYCLQSSPYTFSILMSETDLHNRKILDGNGKAVFASYTSFNVLSNLSVFKTVNISPV